MRSAIRRLLERNAQPIQQGFKLCSRCGPGKGPQLLSEFYKKSDGRDGTSSECKECTALRSKDYRLRNPLVVREADRKKVRDNPELYRRIQSQWNQNNPERRRLHKRKWADGNRQARQAHWTLGNALRSGKIVRPKQCQKCGKLGKIEAHHSDYSKPLQVQWLCSACHGETRIKEASDAASNADVGQDTRPVHGG